MNISKQAIAMKLAHKMMSDDLKDVWKETKSFSYHLRNAWFLVRQIKEVAKEFLMLTLVWKEPVYSSRMGEMKIKGWKPRMIEYYFNGGIMGFMESRVRYPRVR